MQGKAWSIARFFAFLVARHQGDIYELADCCRGPTDRRVQPTGEHRAEPVVPRVPPRTDEVETLFDAWQDGSGRCSQVPSRSTGLPGSVAVAPCRPAHPRDGDARCRAIGIPNWASTASSTCALARAVRAAGRRPRLVPAINSVCDLIEWWLDEVRPQFDDDSNDPGAPLLPSERRYPFFPPCDASDPSRCGLGLADEVAAGSSLVRAPHPSWPASLLCLVALCSGMDLKAHPGPSRSRVVVDHTRYIHVHDGHIEHAWAAANERIIYTRLSDREVTPCAGTCG